MQQYQPIVINFKGGIISPGYLKDILDIAIEAQVAHASFGLRQQLLMNIPAKKYNDFKINCSEKSIIFYQNTNCLPNLVSSYCAVNIFAAESWLTEGVYKDVFDLFQYEPKLKINICDSNQSLVPFFSGHLNWLSSCQSHFWHLAIRLPGHGNTFHWPELVYTNDIARVSASIEQHILDDEPTHQITDLASGGLLFHSVKQSISYISKPATGHLELPVFHLPYYEGFNKDGETSWLGIYRRDELFPIHFLRDVCFNCLENKIGQFYTTSWKSIIIKGIQASQREIWDDVLGTYRINVRHAANELNWQVADNNDDGLILKRHIIRHFDVEDVRTYGLSFAVKTKISTGIFASVIISKQPKKNNTRLKSMDRFEILHTRDFNPNSTDLVSFRKDVSKDQLGTYLVSLCKYFYEQGTGDALRLVKHATVDQNTESVSSSQVYQCIHCLTVYDESAGELENNITPGTTFEELIAYTCPLCEGAKEDFKRIRKDSLDSVVSSF